MLFTTSLDVYSTRSMHLVHIHCRINTDLALNEYLRLAVRRILL